MLSSPLIKFAAAAMLLAGLLPAAVLASPVSLPADIVEGLLTFSVLECDGNVCGNLTMSANPSGTGITFSGLVGVLDTGPEDLIVIWSLTSSAGAIITAADVSEIGSGRSTNAEADLYIGPNVGLGSLRGSPGSPGHFDFSGQSQITFVSHIDTEQYDSRTGGPGPASTTSVTYGITVASPVPVPVSEPATAALVLTGMTGLLVLRRRQG